jgi:AmmeMemoRadiSam system protein B
MSKGRYWRTFCLGVVVSCLAALSFRTPAAGSESLSPFLAQASDRTFYEQAIEKEKPTGAMPHGITGISIPHHLLAVHLMARGFWAASAGQYRRIVIISPDHFRAVRGKFATAARATVTPFGTVPGDAKAVDSLLRRADLFERASDLTREHGIQAILPLVARFFPDTPVIPIVASISTRQSDWDGTVEALASVVDEQTLVIQSTDYSHYLPWGTAVSKDRETLAIIAANDFAKVALLDQPGNMDSKAAQYIQMKLQSTLFGASAVVIANANSAQYGANPNNTTSYIVTAYHPRARALGALEYKEQSTYYFAGDTLIGRYMADAFADKAAANMLISSVLGITHGKPLIINLEGTLADDIVMGVPPGSHMMNAELAASILKAMNVRAASLANNHSLDFGTSGFDETVANLRKLDIAPLVNGVVSDFKDFRLLPLMFLPLAAHPTQTLAAVSELDRICKLKAPPPLVVFAHWGEEYTLREGKRDREIKGRLAACGVSLMIGGHPHVASTHIEAIAGESLAVHSLGNFLFDQNASRSSGAIVELCVFAQGTTAVRLLPIPNFFEMSRGFGHDAR